jgi:hypothetical protein
MRVILLACVVTLLALAASEANASWQLIPGKPYDGAYDERATFLYYVKG